jgi:glycosyltransferase involved in cell wall biosynthesis
MPESTAIRVEQQLPLQKLVEAYRSARVFVVPSMHESFSMPLVEAMSCGLPAIARGLPSLREVGQAGARYVDTDDPAAWSAAIEELLADNVVHARARQAALDRSERYSWQAFASTLAEQM